MNAFGFLTLHDRGCRVHLSIGGTSGGNSGSDSTSCCVCNIDLRGSGRYASGTLLKFSNPSSSDIHSHIPGTVTTPPPPPQPPKQLVNTIVEVVNAVTICVVPPLYLVEVIGHVVTVVYSVQVVVSSAGRELPHRGARPWLAAAEVAKASRE